MDLRFGCWDVPRLSNWHPKDRTNVRNWHLLDIHRTDLCYVGRLLSLSWSLTSNDCSLDTESERAADDLAAFQRQIPSKRKAWKCISLAAVPIKVTIIRVIQYVKIKSLFYLEWNIYVVMKAFKGSGTSSTAVHRKRNVGLHDFSCFCVECNTIRILQARYMLFFSVQYFNSIVAEQRHSKSVCGVHKW